MAENIVRAEYERKYANWAVGDRNDENNETMPFPKKTKAHVCELIQCTSPFA